MPKHLDTYILADINAKRKMLFKIGWDVYLVVDVVNHLG